MARQIVETITDDLDGTANASPVNFAYDGVEYSIDLSSKNRAVFDKLIKPYLAAGTKIAGRQSAKRPSRSRDSKRNDLNAIREWATANGYDVSTRGRIKSEIVAAYDAAQ